MQKSVARDGEGDKRIYAFGLDRPVEKAIPMPCPMFLFGADAGSDDDVNIKNLRFYGEATETLFQKKEQAI